MQIYLCLYGNILFVYKYNQKLEYWQECYKYYCSFSASFLIKCKGTKWQFTEIIYSYLRKYRCLPLFIKNFNRQHKLQCHDKGRIATANRKVLCRHEINEPLILNFSVTQGSIVQLYLTVQNPGGGYIYFEVYNQADSKGVMIQDSRT